MGSKGRRYDVGSVALERSKKLPGLYIRGEVIGPRFFKDVKSLKSFSKSTHEQYRIRDWPMPDTLLEDRHVRIHA